MTLPPLTMPNCVRSDTLSEQSHVIVSYGRKRHSGGLTRDLCLSRIFLFFFPVISNGSDDRPKWHILGHIECGVGFVKPDVALSTNATCTLIQLYIL